MLKIILLKKIFVWYDLWFYNVCSILKIVIIVGDIYIRFIFGFRVEWKFIWVKWFYVW